MSCNIQIRAPQEGTHGLGGGVGDPAFVEKKPEVPEQIKVFSSKFLGSPNRVS